MMGVSEVGRATVRASFIFTRFQCASRSLGVLPDLEAVEDGPEPANAEEAAGKVLQDGGDDTAGLASGVLLHEGGNEDHEGAPEEGSDEHEETVVGLAHAHVVCVSDVLHFRLFSFKL